MAQQDTLVAVEAKDAEMAPRRMWGVFNKKYMGDAPYPLALFVTEGEANGWLLLTGASESFTPVVRSCAVRGTVSVE